MFYLVKCYVRGEAVVIKKREVVGYANVEFLKKRFEKQGYEVDVIMNCMKYINVKKITHPQSLAPRTLSK